MTPLPPAGLVRSAALAEQIKIVDLSEQRRSGILLRQQRLNPAQAIQRPLDRQLRVVPADGALAFAPPHISGFVKHLSLLTQREEAVGETNRHPLPKTGGAPAEIHLHIEDSPTTQRTSFPWGWGGS